MLRHGDGLHELIERHPALQAWAASKLSTVVFRPARAGDALVAKVRRVLLESEPP
ncbi:hypothetical protein GCM10017567_73420 [Amycolatopsis bullii]|uniref:Uncharacterized protein n=1 Tax=Amycolatopsis bullii TaxID=941987 RepID=A0ABQ3KPK3_9PSEU|nr:hypothetical protein GCM10017567_73420 [Amycolatopsis bullii]